MCPLKWCRVLPKPSPWSPLYSRSYSSTPLQRNGWGRILRCFCLGRGRVTGDLERHRVRLETVSALDERVSRLEVRGTCSQSSDTGEPVGEKRARSSPGIYTRKAKDNENAPDMNHDAQCIRTLLMMLKHEACEIWLFLHANPK